jgi:predicted component of type VI protein secretion system
LPQIDPILPECGVIMLNAKLIVVGGEAKTKEVTLKFPCIMGRGKGSTLLLQHPLVSRQHCEIFEANGRLMVRDMGSLNGTYINKEKITEAVLPTGHLLTVGSVTFRAEYNEQQADSTPQERPTTVVTPEEYAQQARTEKAAEPAVTSEPAAVDIDEIGYGNQDGALPNFDMDSFEEVDDTPATPPPPTAPMAIPVAPMAIPVSPVAIPVVPTAPVGQESENAGDDDDLDDFLRSLKK